MAKCPGCLKLLAKDTFHGACLEIIQGRANEGKCATCGENDVAPFLLSVCNSCKTQPNPKGFP